MPSAIGSKVPNFSGKGVDGRVHSLKDYAGKKAVVVVVIGTECPVSNLHIVTLAEMHEKYAGKGVTIVGIHTPEFQREADVERIRAKVEENGLKFPIAVDNQEQNWQAWQNRYWPSIYLIDKRGRIRQRWEGELGAPGTKGERRVRQGIEELLAEK